MPLTQIHGGAIVDIPTAEETAAAVDARHRAFWHEQQAIESARERERQRAKKDLRRSTLLATPAGTRVTILDGIAPEPGYKWVVRYISVYLAAAGTGQAFITSDTTSTLGALTQAKCVAAMTTSSQYQAQSLPEGACILSVGEGLYLNFTQNINGYMIAGWESVAERIGELA